MGTKKACKCGACKRRAELNAQPQQSGTILASGVSFPSQGERGRWNQNVLVVGAPGRGKTTSCMMPNIMNMDSSFVISDTNGKLLRSMGTMLEQNGYEIKVLNLVDMMHSHNYNPFDYIKTEADVFRLIDYLMLNVHRGREWCSDPFWDKATDALLSAIMFFLWTECANRERNFTNVMKLLRAAIIKDDGSNYKSPLDIIFEDLEKKDPNHIAVMQYSIFKQAPAKTAATIVTCAQVDLQYFNLKEYRVLTQIDKMSLGSLGRRKTALFVVTSDADKSKNWLAGLLYSQLFDVLCSQENPIHVRFVLDDFVCAGRIAHFGDILGSLNDHNASCMIGIVDEAQLKEHYGVASTSIISNCDSYVFLGSSNMDACCTAARRLGMFWVAGWMVRRLAYEECLVVCGDKGGIYPKYNLESHQMYGKIALSAESPNVFDVSLKIAPAVPLALRRNKKRPSEQAQNEMEQGEGVPPGRRSPKALHLCQETKCQPAVATEEGAPLPVVVEDNSEPQTETVVVEGAED